MTGHDFLRQLKKVGQIYTGDLHRLSHNIVAIVVIMGISVIPALYAWFNIAANWDPYGKTEGIKVAVVNEDQGYTLDNVSINLGEEITKNLQANKDMGWTFMKSSQEAIKGVKDGQYYAAVVISPTFSADLASIISDDLQRPQIKYYVNEKKNAIAPKITDKGIEAIREQVNSQFIDTVTTAVADLLESAGNEAQTTQSQVMNNLLARMEQMDQALAAFDQSIEAFNSTGTAVTAVLESNRNLLPGLQVATDNAQTLGKSALSAIDYTEKSVAGLTSLISELLAANQTVLANAAALANQAWDDLDSNVPGAQQSLSDAAAQVQAVIGVNDNLISLLQNLGQEMGVDVTTAVAGVESANQALKSLNDALNNAGSDLAQGNSLAAADREAINNALAKAGDGMSQGENAYNNTVKANIDKAVNEVVNDINTLNTTFATLGQGIPQVDAALGSAMDALSSMSQGLAAAQSLITQGRDILAQDREKLEQLAADNRFAMLLDTVLKNPQALGAFMAEPVDIETTALYPVENYGSAMTPFYSTLAFWVGGIVMAALLKTRVRPDKKLQNFGPATAYLGRSLLFLTISFVQATIICLGDLLFLEIQCAHPLLFLLAGWVSALVYTFIIYTLTVSFNDIGKALCVILLVIQIAGTGGTFPIEVIPSFFQGVAPFLPFTYGISALREAVAGLYGYTYVLDLLKLLAFVPFALVLGLFLRKPLLKFNEFYENQLKDTNLM